MNKKGCSIEPDSYGLYTLTITDDGKPIKVVRYIGLHRAVEIAEKEIGNAERTSSATESR